MNNDFFKSQLILPRSRPTVSRRIDSFIVDFHLQGHWASTIVMVLGQDISNAALPIVLDCSKSIDCSSVSPGWGIQSGVSLILQSLGWPLSQFNEAISCLLVFPHCIAGKDWVVVSRGKGQEGPYIPWGKWLNLWQLKHLPGLVRPRTGLLQFIIKTGLPKSSNLAQWCTSQLEHLSWACLYTALASVTLICAWYLITTFYFRWRWDIYNVSQPIR